MFYFFQFGCLCVVREIRVLKEAEANKLKLSPQFLELRFIEAIANNTKIFFGEKVNIEGQSGVRWQWAQ